jgi:hypothetical protein
MVSARDIPADQHDFENEVVTNITKYSTRTFCAWETFLIKEKTVLKSTTLWMMMGHLSILSLGVAFITFCICENPATLQVGKFTDISKFMNTAVGLLMGFFLSSSMSRWFACVHGFLQLLDAIRSLHLQFIGLGVPEDELAVCLRYGVLSSWLMYYNLLEQGIGLDTNLDTTQLLEKYDHDTCEKRALFQKAVAARIEDCKRQRAHPERTPRDTPRQVSAWAAQTARESPSEHLLPSELAALQRVHDPAALLWLWVAGLIGRLAQDGYIPPMSSPTYGRIMNLCEMAHSGIRVIGGSMKVQAPLVYTQLLASLVHLNNMLSAVTFGIVLGLSIGTLFQEEDLGREALNSPDGVNDMSTAFVTFLYCSFGPLVYQSLLILSLDLAQPFESERAQIPLDGFILNLEQDLNDGSMMANNMMHFERPCFKPPYCRSASIVKSE